MLHLGTDFSPSCSSCAECTRLRHNTASAAVGGDGPVPGLSSRAVGTTPNKPTSLGLANFQQAKPEKEPNPPLSPSLEAWLSPGTGSGGKRHRLA